MKGKTAKHVAWAYLIKHGCVYEDWNYYSGRYEVARGQTEACLKDLLMNGIDWDKTNEPKDDKESEFQDTFSDSITVDVIYGEIVLLNGNRYKWGSKFERPANVFQIVEEFYGLEGIGPIAKTKLEKWDETYL